MKKIVIPIWILGILFTMSSFVYADLDEGLVAYYPFNGNAYDETGNGNDGNVYGAALTANRNGKPESAYLFDGDNDYINCGNSADFNIGTVFTVSVWINANSSGGVVWQKKTKYYENKYIVLNNLSPLFYLFYTTDTSTTGFGGILLNQWVHLAATYDGSYIKTYKNGALVTKRTASGNVSDYTSDLYVGTGFDGVIDDLRFYKRALSGTEIMSLFYIESGLHDSDGDGVVDAWDLCPSTPPEAVTDSHGCAARNKVVVIPMF